MRNVLLSIFFLSVFLYGCENGGNTSETLTGSWQSSELELSGQVISGSDVPLVYEFNPDNTFIKIEGEGESAILEKGTWSMDEEETTLTLLYEEGQEVVFDIENISEQKLVLSGTENNLLKKLTLVPQSE